MRDMIFQNFDILFTLAICYAVFRGLRYGYAWLSIGSAISTLGQNQTDEGAETFRHFVEGAVIPNQPAIYNKLRAGWGMVRDARGISRSQKEMVKVALQSRGVYLR